MRKKEEDKSSPANLSMMADYVIGETMGNGVMLETQQNLRMNIESSD